MLLSSTVSYCSTTVSLSSTVHIDYYYFFEILHHWLGKYYSITTTLVSTTLVSTTLVCILELIYTVLLNMNRCRKSKEVDRIRKYTLCVNKLTMVLLELIHDHKINHYGVTNDENDNSWKWWFLMLIDIARKILDAAHFKSQVITRFSSNLTVYLYLLCSIWLLRGEILPSSTHSHSASKAAPPTGLTYFVK